MLRSGFANRGMGGIERDVLLREGWVAKTGMHCTGNSVYVFLFWELRGLSPNFHIHVSVSDLYVPRIGPHISSSRKGRPIVGI